MTKTEPFRRHILLVNKLSSGQYPDLDQLLDYLSDHDITISTRTLQRDIEGLRYSFNIDVQYDHGSQGYYIKEQDFNLNNFLNLAQATLRSDLFKVSMDESLSEYVSFDNKDEVKGLEYLEPIFSSIRNQYVIKITYQSFFKTHETHFILEPYHLREFDNRWYMVAMVDGHDLVFGLDRIKLLEKTTKKFKRKKAFDPRSRFNHIVGISWGEGDIENIRIHFSKEQTNYIKTLPLHSSQVIEREDKNGSEVTYTLQTNFEFIRRLLALGPAIKVLSPLWLVNEVTRLHKEALSQY